MWVCGGTVGSKGVIAEVSWIRMPPLYEGRVVRADWRANNDGDGGVIGKYFSTKLTRESC